MSDLRIWYLTVFPDTYKNNTYFPDLDLAERFVMHVGERYGIWGKVVEVQEVKQRRKHDRRRTKKRALVSNV